MNTSSLSAAKGRGFCASCGGKRMTSLAAELTDRVIPFVPVRQFVLSLPPALRYLLAYDHGRCLAVLRIYIRSLQSFYRQRARQHGVGRGQTGTVTFIQRFGSAANLNLHFHVIALDGVFAAHADRSLRFHAAPTPTDAEVMKLVAKIRRRVLRHLERQALTDSELRSARLPRHRPCWRVATRVRYEAGKRSAVGAVPSWNGSVQTLTSRGDNRREDCRPTSKALICTRRCA